jgi:hypothetical protein
VIDAMPITTARSVRVAAVALSIAVLGLAGCGTQTPDQDAPSGNTVTQDGVAYTVEISRTLDPLEPDDRSTIAGLPHVASLEGEDSTLVGVFLQAQNNASGVRRAIAAPELVSAEGQRYRPLPVAAGNGYDYHGGSLAAGAVIPGPTSLGAQSATDGAALVYRVPTSVFLTNRPFTIAFGTGSHAASVQLDL